MQLLFLVFVYILCYFCVALPSVKNGADFKIQRNPRSLTGLNSQNKNVKLQDLFKNSRRQGKNRSETYYEPYWENGEWVFYRTTKKPIHKFLTDQGLYNVSVDVPVVDTNPGVDTYRECNIGCPKIYYKFYGPICGMRFNTAYHFNYEFKEFHNICELEYYNCRWKSYTFRVIHKGSCAENKPLRIAKHYVKDVLSDTKWYLENAPARKLPLPIAGK